MLTAEQRTFYEENGYLVVPGLLDQDRAATYRRETHELIDGLSRQRDMEATWGSAREIGGTATATRLLHCHNVEYYSAAFTRLLLDDSLTAVAAGLIGSPNVQLHHTKAFIKPPENGSPFPMHQDCPYFPHALDSMIAAIIHFDDAPEEKGCLRMVPGSHKQGLLEHDSSGGWHLPFEQYPLESAVSLPAKAGDAVFFSYLTIHGSGVNVSDEARTTLLIQMRDAADSPTDTGNWEPGQGLMLRGTSTSTPPRP